MTSHLLLSVGKASVACLHPETQPEEQVQGTGQGSGAQTCLPGWPCRC